VHAQIAGIAHALPSGVLSNQDLNNLFPEWSSDKISEKTGIWSRHIAGPAEFSSDLATQAAQNLFEKLGIDKSQVDFIILCTQSPDFYLPSTSCIVQESLGLAKSVGAIDITQGCSGYIYGLGLSKALIDSGQANSVLFLTSDTYSKFINNEDKRVRTIFGDGATATLITKTGKAESFFGISYGTDGSGAKHLIVPSGGLREGIQIAPKSDANSRLITEGKYDLFMDGPEIFNFTLREIPLVFEKILSSSGLEKEDIDFFVFHQANKFMLEHLMKSLNLPKEKFPIMIETTGNTVSSSIPLVLSQLDDSGILKKGMKIMVLGFGVGLSWGGMVISWT